MKAVYDVVRADGERGHISPDLNIGAMAAARAYNAENPDEPPIVKVALPGLSNVWLVVVRPQADGKHVERFGSRFPR